MEIVKFTSGKYGVRKWTFDLFLYAKIGWVYAVNKSGQWAEKSHAWNQEFDTKAYAREILADMQDRNNITNDRGIRIK